MQIYVVILRVYILAGNGEFISSEEIVTFISLEQKMLKSNIKIAPEI